MSIELRAKQVNNIHADLMFSHAVSSCECSRPPETVDR
jgi:hypothetical protein